jgi:hypothetical protein
MGEWGRRKAKARFWWRSRSQKDSWFIWIGYPDGCHWHRDSTLDGPEFPGPGAIPRDCPVHGKGQS